MDIIFNKFLQISKYFSKYFTFPLFTNPIEVEEMAVYYCLCTDIKGPLLSKVANQIISNLVYFLHRYKSHLSFKAVNQIVFEIWHFSSRVQSMLLLRYP